jgi:gamma-glutamylcyclotransferase (GGCT)/AIG2-like uncharacterized protein YtfP
MYFFAYDHNLDSRQISGLCPTAKNHLSATLHHYRLVFCDWSRHWRGGVAGIKAQRGERVLGGLYEVDKTCLIRLDRSYGYPAEYDRLKVLVNTDVREEVEAFTYIKKRFGEEAKPGAELLTALQKGYRDWGLL